MSRSRTFHDGPAASPHPSSPPAASPSAHPPRSRLLTVFDHLASRVTHWAGSPAAFCGAVALVLVWGLTGPLFGYSDAWQLVINTGTTIVTFLMVFLIQQSQNKDSTAVHLKLDELLASSREANNRMIGIESLDERDLRKLAAFYTNLASRAQSERGTGDAGGDADEARHHASAGERSLP